MGGGTSTRMGMVACYRSRFASRNRRCCFLLSSRSSIDWDFGSDWSWVLAWIGLFDIGMGFPFACMGRIGYSHRNQAVGRTDPRSV
jgi:hypothetical protein